jgi:hypothetical protein
MKQNILPRSIATAFIISWAANASAAMVEVPLPEIKKVHPRLYADSNDLDILRANFPANILPKDVGTVEIQITPSFRSQFDAQDAILFGSMEDTTNRILIRHVDSKDTNEKIAIQVGFNFPDGSRYVFVKPGQTAKIRMHYNKFLKLASIQVENAELEYTTGFEKVWNNIEWSPSATPQRFDFLGRKNTKVSSINIANSSGESVWHKSDIDYDLGSARYFMEREARATAAEIDKCQIGVVYTDSSVCNVWTNGRSIITDTASKLGLIYQLTDDPIFLAAAEKYAQVIIGAPVTAGEEWSMSSRVGALGIIYDWFFGKLSPGTTSAIPQRIIDTIKADIQDDPTTPRYEADKDLIAAVCGNSALVTGSSTLACAGTPNIENFYITGHQASAMHGMAIGLLAIADGTRKAEVTPLLTTIYNHLIQGSLAARDIISVDGGHHALFAYGTGGEIIERLIMWRRVLDNPARDGVKLERTFVPKLIKPFIYALRSESSFKQLWDGSFPASGDNFKMKVIYPEIGLMALAAATRTLDKAAADYPEQLRDAGTATAFYEDYIKNRSVDMKPAGLWDRLYFPSAKTPRVELDALPLGERFHVAGNAFMRDTWNYNEATLLDFKSTSFSSENHQHLDQNSFSLFYKAPLLVDSGVYDNYGSSHWLNYYTRTIAHNSVVVFDPTENFGGVSTNDGGQWYRGSRYPTLAQITGNGSNVLQGITSFENGSRYSYVAGNASKAYQSSPTTKLDSNYGFIRRIMYLRRTDAKPIILIYDQIDSPQKIPATSLFHSVGRPYTFGAQTAIGDGRYKIGGGWNPPLRVRNGGGMLTIEPLIPQTATIRLVGGTEEDGGSCLQSDGSRSSDCRFMVRTARNNAFEWINYSYITTTQSEGVESDFGAWRIEISPVGEEQLQATRYQFFLNVLHVDGNDDRSDAPQLKTSHLLPSSNGTAHAVALDSNTTVVFSTYQGKMTSLQWKPENVNASVLVSGLQPNLRYKFEKLPNSDEYAVTQASNGPYVSSNEGVLDIPAK